MTDREAGGVPEATRPAAAPSHHAAPPNVRDILIDRHLTAPPTNPFWRRFITQRLPMHHPKVATP